MEKCIYYEKCPIYKKCIDGEVKQIFVSHYCEGPMQENCARKIKKDSDLAVPMALLPNGEYLDNLQ